MLMLMSKWIKRVLRSVRLVLKDEKIPRPIRWFGAVGLLPIPGPIDELVLMLVAIILIIFYRRPLFDAWAKSV